MHFCFRATKYYILSCSWSNRFACNPMQWIGRVLICLGLKNVFCILCNWLCKTATAERFCYTLTSPSVFWDDTIKDINIKKVYFWGHKTPAVSLRHLTIACCQISSALTKSLPYLLEAESSLNCLVSTAWSRTKHLVIVSLKAHTCIVTQSHLPSWCSAARKIHSLHSSF